MDQAVEQLNRIEARFVVHYRRKWLSDAFIWVVAGFIGVTRLKPSDRTMDWLASFAAWLMDARAEIIPVRDRAECQG